ncbi:MAG: hypothetical protein J2P45_14495, partial [Candidatus Dormibacteraeota bacterium]|nr:hypothetical protein [Candidatus Dormibacteraeota bacterium]
ASHFLATCLDRLQSLTPPPDPAPSRSLAAAARQRAAEAFELLLDDRPPAVPTAEATARLLASGSQVIMAGDLITLEAESGYRALPPKEAEVEFRVQAQALLDGLASLGGRLEQAHDWPPAAAVSVPALREAALACLRRWKQRRIDSKSAAGAVAAAHWIAFLGAMAAALEQSAITASSRSSWYAA